MTNFTKSLCKISIPVTLQCMLGMLFVGLIMSSRYGAKVRAFKQRIFMKNNMQLQRQIEIFLIQERKEKVILETVMNM